MTSSRKGLWTGIGLLCFLLALLLWKSVDEAEQAVHAAKLRKSSRTSDSSEEGRRRKPAPREVLAQRSADDESLEARHFRNFFLRSMALGTVPPTPEQIASTNPIYLPDIQIAGMTGTARTVSLFAAIERVKAEYQATAKETKEETLPLAIDLTAVDTSKPINLRTPRAPVVSVLRLLAAVSGNRLVGSGPDFRMEAIPDDGRKLSFNQEFGAFDLSRLVNFGVLGEPTLPQLDEESPGQKPSEPDLLEVLKQLGFQFDPALEATMKRLPGGKTVIEASNGSARDLELLRAALALASTDTPLMQAKFTSKMIRLPAGAEWNGDASFSTDTSGLQLQLREFSSREGTELTTLPSVVSRPGQTAIIEIGPSGSSPTANSKTGGIRIAYNSQPLGTGTEDSFQFNQILPLSISPDGQPVRQTTPILAGRSIGNGETVQYTSGKDAEGNNVIFVHRLERIDATGRPFETGGTPVKKP